ncbi:hypothetical protein STENM223S_00331 [Streptomyces tendae]
MPDQPEDAHRVGARAVRVVGLQQDAHAESGGVLGGRAQPPGGHRVGLLGALVGAAAGEDPDVGGAQVVGEVQQAPHLGDHGVVVAGRGDPRVPRHAERFDTGRLELGGHRRPFVGAEAGMDRFLGMGAQLDTVVTVRGREPQHVGQGQSGNTESGERQLHAHGAYPRSRDLPGDTDATFPDPPEAPAHPPTPPGIPSPPRTPTPPDIPRARPARQRRPAPSSRPHANAARHPHPARTPMPPGTLIPPARQCRPAPSAGPHGATGRHPDPPARQLRPAPDSPPAP